MEAIKIEKTFGEPKEQKIIGFSLVENGTDSIKKALDCIEAIDELVKGVDHTLKDAVIFLNHGIEILLKVMLEERDPSLIFYNKKKYQLAKELLEKEDKKDIFDVDSSLKTLSLTDALKCLKNECSLEIDNKLEEVIEYLNKTRNKLMHSNFKLDEQGLSKLKTELKYCNIAVYDFFNKHIKSFNTHITEARFEVTKEDEREHYEAWAEAEKLGLLD